MMTLTDDGDITAVLYTDHLNVHTGKEMTTASRPTCLSHGNRRRYQDGAPRITGLGHTN